MKTELFTPAELADMVDTLAQIKAEIAELQNRADTYKAALIAAEVTEVEGTKHRATISETYRVTIDWQTIAKVFTPSSQLITAHTHKAEEPTIPSDSPPERFQNESPISHSHSAPRIRQPGDLPRLSDRATLRANRWHENTYARHPAPH